MDAQALSVESANIARRESAWQRLQRHWSVRIGGAVLALLVLTAVCAPWLGTVDPTLFDAASRDLRPGQSGEITTLEGEMIKHKFLMIGESRFLSTKVNGVGGGACGMTCGQLRSRYEAFDPARHGKSYNQLFCDGHVAAMDPWVLFNPTNTAAMWNSDHQPHPELWRP